MEVEAQAKQRQQEEAKYEAQRAEAQERQVQVEMDDQAEALAAAQLQAQQAAASKAAVNVTKKRIAPKAPKVADADVSAGVGAAIDLSPAGLKKLTVKDLRERCKGAGVATSGKKAELIERLLNALVSA